jgi:NTP pyrophosphatase (non-canonical NTP hydrolase)
MCSLSLEVHMENLLSLTKKNGVGIMDEIKDLNDLQKVVHQNSKAHGWWDTKDDDVGHFVRKMFKVQDEICEAGREVDHGRGFNETYYTCENPDSHTSLDCTGICSMCRYGKPEGVGYELADAVIRILDFCEWAGIPLWDRMVRKHTFNLTREYRHGGKRIE